MKISNPNLLSVIRLLAGQREWITNQQLSGQSGFSSRTISTYIKQINQEIPGLILSSKKGYMISEEKADLIKDLEADQENTDRLPSIVRDLVLRTTVDLYDLAEKYYVSESTIEADMQKIRTFLKEFNCTLVRDHDTFTLTNASERNKRRIINRLMVKETRDVFEVSESLQKTYQDYDVDWLKDTIITAANNHHYYINDYVISDLLLHILITIDRIKSENTLKDYVFDDKITSGKEYRIAKEIAQEIQDKYGIAFSEVELAELTILLMSKISISDFQKLSFDDIRSLIPEEYYNLLCRILDRVNELFYVDLKDDTDFMTRFIIHLRNLLVRYQNHTYNKNPLQSNIKNTYPMIYEIAAYIAHKFHKEAGIRIAEDEIAFIALHIGSALERANTTKEKLRCILYCPHYYDFGDQVIRKVEKAFGDEILFTDVRTKNATSIRRQDADFLITTVPVSLENGIPIIETDLFISSSDIEKIGTLIRTIKEQKEKDRIKLLISGYIDGSLFRYIPDPITKDECLVDIYDRFHHHGYVSETFINDLRQREEISPTDYVKGLAMPHTLEMNDYRTALSVTIVEKPICWSKKNDVSLIISLAVSEKDRMDFSEMFEKLIEVLSSEENIRALIKTKDFPLFLSKLFELIDKTL